MKGITRTKQVHIAKEDSSLLLFRDTFHPNEKLIDFWILAYQTIERKIDLNEAPSWDVAADSEVARRTANAVVEKSLGGRPNNNKDISTAAVIRYQMNQWSTTFNYDKLTLPLLWKDADGKCV